MLISFLANPWLYIPLAIIVVVALLIEYGIRRNVCSYFIARKLLHIIAITCCAVAILHTTHTVYLGVLFLIGSIILSILLYYKVLATSNSTSYGIALFPLAFFILLCFTSLPLQYIYYSVLTLAISDAAAGIVGYYYGRRTIIFLAEPKTMLGFFTFWVVTTGLYALVFPYTHYSTYCIIGLVPALVELFSYKGSDNVTVPLCTALWLYIVQHINANVAAMYLLYTAVLVLLACIVYFKRWLTLSGTMAALLTGILIIYMAGIIHLLPLAIFFVSGSLAAKLTAQLYVQGHRNAVQVYANGIVAICCISIYYLTGIQVYYIAYFASIAISFADTMSSDIGKYYRQKTYDIIHRTPVAVGLSGGISIAGTMAGVITALVYAGLVYAVFPISIVQAVIICVIGILGMVTDSVLGSLLQAKYRNHYGSIVEEKNTYLVKGYSWCTNDVVNVMSNAITIVLYIIIAITTGLL